MRYFGRVTGGLEQVAWREIEQRTEAALLGFGHRRVDFSCAAPPADLLALRSVDDIYVFVTRLPGLDHTRASLAAFERLRAIDFTSPLKSISAVRSLGEPLTYAVTASFLGK